MIIDKIENASLYSGLNARIQKALNYIQHTDFDKILTGRHEIDYDLVYALVYEYNTKNEDESFLEAHQKYIDVQFMIEGEEVVGYTALDNQKVVKPYDANDDYMLFKEKSSSVFFKKGMFAIFFPDDLHMPGISISSPQKVKKVVVKVKI